MKKIGKKVVKAVSGTVIGLLGGFFGGGGGMIAVPVLNKGLGLKVKTAHATSMLIILPMSVLSAITYYSRGIFDIRATLIAGAGVIIGGIIGALLLKKFNNLFISVLFSLLMIVAGIKLIV